MIDIQSVMEKLPPSLSVWWAKAKQKPLKTYMSAIALVTGVYFFLLAAPIYVSESQFSIRGKEAVVSQTLLSGIVAQGSSQNDSFAAVEYIRSHDMLTKLEKRHDLRKHYSGFRIDPLNKLGWRASDEEFLSFYRKMTNVFIDRESNIVTLEVRAFDGDFSTLLGQSILALSEDYVNNLSQHLRDITLKHAAEELTKARRNVLETRQKLSLFRNRTGDIDPVLSGTGQLAEIFELESEVNRQRAELASLLTIAQDNSPEVAQIKARITSLEERIREQRGQLAGVSLDTTLAQQLVEYEALLVDKEYADQRLLIAMAEQDAARTLAGQQERFVVRIISPSTPTEATLPNRISGFLLTLVLALVAYGIFSFGSAAIIDHRGD